MKTRHTTAGRNGERGLIITLVAVVLLFVVGAMAVLAIDVATFYTARSEAQRAADAAALSGARALANSGMTSNPADTDLIADAKTIAANLALQVATNNEVGGRDLQATVNCANEVCVTFNDGDPTFGTNPHVTVTVTRSDLPTFFARIFGRNLVTVQASAVAEAYNPSGVNVAVGGATPVAPTCVKPWVLPNMSPIDGSPIFDATTGAIQNASGLLGYQDPAPPYTSIPQFLAECSAGGGPSPPCGPPWPQPPNFPKRWQYYPGAPSTFTTPTQALPDCGGSSLSAYQLEIAGCVPTPIACNSQVDLDQTPYVGRNRETVRAVDCLTHTQNDQGDTTPPSYTPPLPALTQSLQFVAGADNPIPGIAGKNVLVSDSLVIVPVANITTTNPLGPAQTQAQVIGFVQLFLNWDGIHANTGSPHAPIKTMITNLIGCGTSSTGTPIYGNGPSAVTVRLVHP